MFVSLLLYHDSPSECNVTKSYCSLINPRFQGSGKESVYICGGYIVIMMYGETQTYN